MVLSTSRISKTPGGGQAADALSKRFGFNIPQRWSIAHLYQAMLNRESHVRSVAFVTTLAGYIHYRLTGEKVIGIGDPDTVMASKDVREIYLGIEV